MVLDIAIGIIVVFAMVLGYRAGFLYTFLHMLGWILSFVLAFVWSPWIKKTLMEKTSFYDLLYDTLEGKFAGALTLPAKVTDDLPALLQNTVSQLTGQVTGFTAESLANLFFLIISFLLALIAVKFVFWLLISLVSKKHNKGVTGFVDGLLGLILGAIKGMVLVFVLLAIMVPVAGLVDLKVTEILMEWLHNSRFAGELYDNNLIMLIIRDFLV